MSALSEFYDLLMPEAPGVTTAMMDLHLVDVAREFCASTSLWRVDFTPQNTVASQAAYTLATGVAATEVTRIVRLSVNGTLLWEDTDAEPKSSTDVEPKYDRKDQPFSLSLGMDTITLIGDEIPTAAVTGGLVIKGAIKPTKAATTLPDFIRTQHSEAMRYGVLSRLMMMGRKPWTDRELAAYYERQWHAALNFAAYQGAVGNNRQPLRVKMWG